MGLDVTMEQLRVTAESEFAAKELEKLARKEPGVILLAIASWTAGGFAIRRAKRKWPPETF